MPKRSKSKATRTAVVGSREGKVSADRLESQREELLARLARVHDNARVSPGYRTALRLLNPMFRKASLAARVAILQSAAFMVEILELTPPFM